MVVLNIFWLLEKFLISEGRLLKILIPRGNSFFMYSQICVR